MILGLITMSVLGYAFVGGLFGWFFYAASDKRCKRCRNGRCSYDHGGAAGLMGIFWPFTFPACAGAMLANRFTTNEERAKAKATQKDRDHERRIAELQAEQRLAQTQKERTLADIKFLVENGIHADVPGLYETGLD